MELAVIYTLNPPSSLDSDVPIAYKCGECGEDIMSYNVESHALGTHKTELYVLKNRVEEPPPVEDVMTESSE